MHSAIVVSHEKRRGCGYRKVGGLYLVGSGQTELCCKLPLPLDTCPTCGHGIHPSRGWTWVDSNALFASVPSVAGERCTSCPLQNGVGLAGLLWVGQRFYTTPVDFMLEAQQMGVSRRIAHVPHKFELGMWILLAHRSAIPVKSLELNGDAYKPGIFYVFQPKRIDYIVNGSETNEEIDQIVKRGLTPVMVIREKE